MKKYEKLLRNLGMNEYETSIYLTLLENGPLHISAIATIVGHHRPLVYKTIGGLESDGYIAQTISPGGKRTLYQVTSPKILIRKSTQIQQQTELMIPELEAIYDKTLDTPKFSIKQGIEAIRSIHSDLVHSLPKGGVYYRYSSSRKEYGEKSIYTPPDYTKLQQEKELERYIITNEERRISRAENPYREIVSVPRQFDAFDDNITKLIYGNTVAMIDYDAQIGWVIESARFAQYEKKIFMLLFKSLKK